MKKLLVLALTLAAATASAQNATAGKGTEAAGAQAAKAPAFKAHVLTNAEFDKLVADPGKVLIVDVRRPDEQTSIGSFPVYLSVQQADLEKNLQWIPRDRAIVTVSNHASRGGKAADLLAGKGFKVVGTIGVQTYEQDGGKISHIAPPKPKDTVASTGTDK